MSSFGQRLKRIEDQVGEAALDAAREQSGDRESENHPVIYQPDPAKDQFLVVSRYRNVRVILPYNHREPFHPQSKIIVGVDPINDASLRSLATRQQRE